MSSEFTTFHQQFLEIFTAWENISKINCVELRIADHLFQKAKILIDGLTLTYAKNLTVPSIILLGSLWEILRDLLYLTNHPELFKKFHQFVFLEGMETDCYRLECFYRIISATSSQGETDPQWFSFKDELSKVLENFEQQVELLTEYSGPELKKEVQNLKIENITTATTEQCFQWIEQLSPIIKKHKKKDWRTPLKLKRESMTQSIEQALRGDEVIDPNFFIPFDQFIYALRNSATHSSTLIIQASTNIEILDLSYECFSELFRYSARKLRSHFLGEGKTCSP